MFFLLKCMSTFQVYEYFRSFVHWDVELPKKILIVFVSIKYILMARIAHTVAAVDGANGVFTLLWRICGCWPIQDKYILKHGLRL